jgi:hypothetical protein
MQSVPDVETNPEGEVIIGSWREAAAWLLNWHNRLWAVIEAHGCCIDPEDKGLVVENIVSFGLGYTPGEGVVSHDELVGHWRDYLKGHRHAFEAYRRIDRVIGEQFIPQIEAELAEEGRTWQA